MKAWTKSSKWVSWGWCQLEDWLLLSRAEVSSSLIGIYPWLSLDSLCCLVQLQDSFSWPGSLWKVFGPVVTSSNPPTCPQHKDTGPPSSPLENILQILFLHHNTIWSHVLTFPPQTHIKRKKHTLGLCTKVSPMNKMTPISLFILLNFCMSVIFFFYHVFKKLKFLLILF